MQKKSAEPPVPRDRQRRALLTTALRCLAGTVVGGGLVHLMRRGSTTSVWQLDPAKCIQCGRCATACVLTPSAVKCVHAFDVCGYCKLCGGYQRPNAKAQNTAAENQLCPAGAIKRRFIEDPFYEYMIDESLCIGCARCVKGCASFGNGSLYTQVRHDRCVGCNQCAIARVCPAQAFRRVPRNQAYIPRSSGEPS
jgi:electron transport complex protein RnfB